MRVVVASERLGDLLTASEALAAIIGGWADVAPHDSLDGRAVSGGGRGMVEAIGAHRGGELHVTPAQDALGRDTLATMLVLGDGAGRTAYLDAGQVCGPAPDGVGDAWPALVRARTRGVGELLLAARRLDVDRVVIGLQDAAVPDLGIGLLAAVAGVSGPLDLAELTGADVLALARAAREQLAGITLQGTGDLHAPLLGLSGASVRAATTWGVGDSQAQHLELIAGRLVHEIRHQSPEPRDLLTGLPIRIDRRPGVGAGDGLGFGLGLLGATVTDAHEAVLNAVGFVDALDGADLLVAGVESIDAVSLHESTLPALVAAAAARGIPAVALAARGGLGRRETMAAGLSGAYAVYPTHQAWPPDADDLAQRLRLRAAAVARTWSPPWA
ncbi:MAG: glycerate kinase [Dermatophilaceae bacterium]